MTERTACRFDEEEWRKDCLRWRGRVLTGKERHWCYDWDGLPIDETTPEWPCSCDSRRPNEGDG
jgi:hypothetical protein